MPPLKQKKKKKISKNICVNSFGGVILLEFVVSIRNIIHIACDLAFVKRLQVKHPGT